MAVAKNEADKLAEREKALDAREKELAAREAKLAEAEEEEDLTPTPTQAENDAAKEALASGGAAYKTRDAKAD